MTIKSPGTLAELLSTATDLRRATRHTRSAALTAGPEAVERISHAYNFAGVEDSRALAEAGKTLRAVQRIVEALEQIDAALGLIAAETRKAAAAVEEAQTQRAHQARTLKI